VAQAQQPARTPRRRNPEGEEKARRRNLFGKCVLAPSLEHGYCSNEEQYDRGRSKGISQHNLIPLNVRLIRIVWASELMLTQV
jgi:hypothetical protein